MTDVASLLPDLRDLLRSLDLSSIACSAAIDTAGALSAVNLAGKIEAATARYRLGLLHGLVIAAAEQRVDQRLLNGEGDVLPLHKAATFADAIRAIDDLSRPRLAVADRVPATFEIFGVGAEQPFDAEIYQDLPLLRRVPRDRLPGERDADSVDERSRMRDLPLERWEEQLWGDGGQFEEQAVPLEQALRERSGGRAPRLVLLGSPGSGKSTVLDYVAHACLYRNPPLTIGDRRYLPVKIGLRRWEQWCEDNHRYRLAEYLGEALAGRGKPCTVLWDHWLAASRIFVLLDGLDELSGDVAFYELALKGLLVDREASGCPMILTSRTVSYDAHRRLAPHLPVYTLGGLSPRQQAAFIRRYPAPPASRFDAEALIAELRRLPSIKPLAANPLLLSIICLVASGPQAVQLPATRGALYEAAVHHILGRLPHVPAKEIYVGVAEPLLTEKKAFLEELALELWLRDEGCELAFSEQTLIGALKRILKRERESTKLARCLVRDWICNSGLLRRDESKRYTFLHLTLQEYLLADAMARRIDSLGWTRASLRIAGRQTTPTALLHRKVWDKAWREVIPLLAGRLLRPGPLLEMLVGASDKVYVSDPGHYLLFFAGRSLSEISPGRIPQELEQRIIENLDWLLHSASGWVSQSAATALSQIPRSPAFDSLTRALQDSEAWVRLSAAKALVRQKDRNASDVLMDLAISLDSVTRFNVMRFISKEDEADSFHYEPDFIADSIKAAVFDEDPSVRKVAAQALKRIGGPVVMEKLKELSEDPDYVTRFGALEALAEFDDPLVAESLLATLEQGDEVSRWQASRNLGRMASPCAVKGLVSTLRTDSSNAVRMQAAESLGQKCDPCAREALFDALQDPFIGVRVKASTALVFTRDPRVVATLRQSLRDSNPNMAIRAAYALAQIGDTGGADVVIRHSQNPDSEVRQLAAWALGHMFDLQVVGPLVEMLWDANFEVRMFAAGALEHHPIPKGITIALDRLAAQWTRVAENDQRFVLHNILARWVLRTTDHPGWAALSNAFSLWSRFALAVGLARYPEGAAKAESLLWHLILVLPDWRLVVLELGKLLAEWPERETTIRSFLASFADKFPDTSEAWKVRAEMHHRLGNAAAALEAEEVAVRRCEPPGERALCLHNCTRSYLRMQRLDKAEECLLLSEGLDDDHPMLHARRAEVSLERGDLASALAFAARSIECAGNERLSAPYFIHALALLCLGQADHAATAYARGLELETDWRKVVGAVQDLARQERRLGSLPGAAGISRQLHDAAERLKSAWPPAPEQADN